MQLVHFQVRVGVFSCQDKYLFRYLWYCGKKRGLAWSVLFVLLSTTIRVITVVKMLWTATNWAALQSARFALVIEYVSSIHPWANSRCWISQSERALCFSYVIKMTWLFNGKKRYFSTTSTVMRFPPLHKKPTKCFKGRVSLPFMGSLHV